MKKAKEFNINEIILKANAESFAVAYEIAARTGTALIFCENGKIIKVKPKSKLISKKRKQKTVKSNAARRDGK